jgi:hypothetical protein
MEILIKNKVQKLRDLLKKYIHYTYIYTQEYENKAKTAGF